VNWTTEIITRDWLGGAAIAIPSEEVLAAFVRCERMLGPGWIERASIGTPGTMPTLNVVAMGQRLAYIQNVPNNETLIEQLRKGEVAAYAELKAIYVLSNAMRPAIELYPTVLVGKSERLPDFRARCFDTEQWTFIEVTQPDISEEQQDLAPQAQSVVNLVDKIKRSFALEIFLRREPDDFAAFREHVERCCLESPDSSVTVRQELPDGLGLPCIRQCAATGGKRPDLSLNFDPAQDFTDGQFVLTSDGSGGTDVTLVHVYFSTIVASSEVLNVSSARPIDTLDFVLSGGILNVLSGGVVSGSTVSSGGVETVSSGGTDIGTGFISGQENIESGGVVSGATVWTGGVQTVSSGGTTVSAVLSGGTQNVFGLASTTTVDSGGSQSVFSGARRAARW
jgi:autotransporter passenger strand-loop-strand repeat protein